MRTDAHRTRRLTALSLFFEHYCIASIPMMKWNEKERASRRSDEMFLVFYPVVAVVVVFSLSLCFVDVFLTTLKDTLTIRWKDVIVLLLAMVVDMVSQPQLTEVFTTNHSHHRSSSTHRRNSSTINQSSTSTSTDHATMTNGQRVLVSRDDDTGANQIEPSLSI